MKRLRPDNPNTVEAMDTYWRGEMERGHRPFDLYRYLAMREDIQPGASVLEVGAGCSDFLTWVLNTIPGCSATALDSSGWAMSYMLQLDPRVQWLHGDVFDYRPEHEGWNAVLSGECIEHQEDPAAFVEALARLTRPGGFYRITTLLPHLQETSTYHLWAFEEADLIGFFERAVSDVVHLKVVGNYFVVTGYRAPGRAA